MLCRDELDIPMFYDQHVICKELKSSAIGIETMIEVRRRMDLKLPEFTSAELHSKLMHLFSK